MAIRRVHKATEQSAQAGKRIKECRINLELSQTALGKLCDISHNHISNIENGVENVSDDALARLSSALKTSFEYLKTGNVTALKALEKRQSAKTAKSNIIPGQMSIFDLFPQ